MLKRVALAALVVVATACSGTPLNPDDFELEGDWGGNLIQGSFGLGVLRLSFTPREDGTVERYEVEGTLFFSNVLRRIDGGRLDYDTGSHDVLMEFPIFPTPVAALNGTFDGTTLAVADTVLCFCSMSLTQEQTAARVTFSSHQ